MPDPRLSFVRPIGASYYIRSSKLTADDYQGLVDRGWRRSGTLLYKPDNRLSCCAQYTIRIPVADFKPRKDQRTAVNKWNRFVLGDEYQKEAAKLYPISKEEKKRQRNEYDLARTIHESEYSEVRTPPEPAHRFEVTLEEDAFTQEKFVLFQNYQEHVHREPAAETTPGSFKRFLCGSPIIRETVHDHSTGKTKKLGSYHQVYRLDGRLIAMAVLDLLPHCVSGVYFMYHSDFEKWSFGKLSALREANLALEAAYSYYYMGYYIHSCQKMRYKGDYQPQYFLDLDTFAWDRLDEEATKLMEKKKYVSMSRERALKATQNGPAPSPNLDGSEGKDTQMTNQYEENGNSAESDSNFAVQSVADIDQAGASVIECGMPGVMSVDELEQQIDLDDINIKISPTTITKTSNIVSWDSGSMTDLKSLKGIIAELAACVGPEVMNSGTLVANFSRDSPTAG
ncbi:arginyl-tRNA-protein transferase [Rhizodiscina lignyota]|uniref:Arginyl-tRNA--protein transferase 1 n=1 Tax=Rhizodiscina lignyota TaxID=1504668 RepID=A0A9P4IHC7_9PEZI|nr:arginyl-tRNA-protein transferase [Rhizodiscina lignyota]